MNREEFFEEFAALLNKYSMENALIVYVWDGQVFNTTFNAVENEASEVLNHISDVIDTYFNKVPD